MKIIIVINRVISARREKTSVPGLEQITEKSSCQYGLWRTSKNGWSSVRRFTLYPKNSIDLGRFKLCINSYRIDGREMAETEVVPTDEPDINGEMNWRASNRTQYASYFMGITCFN